MLKQLHPETRSIVQRVEALSGCPVDFRPDSGLGVQATLQKARKGAPAHLLRYQPGSAGLDYWVAYQCGHALRFYSLPPDQRLDFSDTGEGAPHIESWLLAARTQSPDDLMRVPAFARQIEQWALMSLLSYPVGMRVDRWLHDTCPALRVEQAQGIAQVQTENQRLLSLAMGGLTLPARLLALPAACALEADRLLETPLHAPPWLASGAMAGAQTLCDLLVQTPDEPAHDRALIDAWAQALGMTDWYRWQPYRMLM